MLDSFICLFDFRKLFHWTIFRQSYPIFLSFNLILSKNKIKQTLQKLSLRNSFDSWAFLHLQVFNLLICLEHSFSSTLGSSFTLSLDLVALFPSWWVLSPSSVDFLIISISRAVATIVLVFGSATLLLAAVVAIIIAFALMKLPFGFYLKYFFFLFDFFLIVQILNLFFV